MTEDTKQTAKSVAKLGTAVIVATATGLFVANQQLTPPVVPAFRMAWDDDNPTNLPGTLTAEFWSSTNLIDWQLKTNVPVHPGSNFLAVPRDKASEFFKVRNRWIFGGTTNFSDWARKQ